MSETSTTDADAFIEVRDLVAGYEGKIAVHGVSLSVGQSEHVSLLGPSGCGKSTTLRCIAGLETPISGEINIGSTTVFSSSKGINVPPEKRNLSMVFQSYAIWPHMTVYENVAFGLRVRGMRGKELDDRVRQGLEIVGMSEFGDRPATDLSGGQQQRVALARSYAVQPRAILLDEPLSNLDARLRARMRDELKDMQRRSHVATIYVTHDQEEAMAISDRIIVMREGVIEQLGSPLDIYKAPHTEFVADFIGAANILAGTVAEAKSDSVTLKIGDAIVLSRACKPAATAQPNERQLAAVRTVYPQLSRLPLAGLPNCWPARIARRTFLGDVVAYIVAWPGGELRVNRFPTDILDEGDEVHLHIPPEYVVLVAE